MIIYRISIKMCGGYIENNFSNIRRSDGGELFDRFRFSPLPINSRNLADMSADQISQSIAIIFARDGEKREKHFLAAKPRRRSTAFYA